MPVEHTIHSQEYMYIILPISCKHEEQTRTINLQQLQQNDKQLYSNNAFSYHIPQFG